MDSGKRSENELWPWNDNPWLQVSGREVQSGIERVNKTCSREESCLLWTREPLAGCTSGLAVWRRSSRSTSSCSAPWLEVLQTVLTGRGFCPSRWDFLSIFQWENTLESCFQPVTCSVDCTSCGIERGSVLLLPASCSPTWLTITRWRKHLVTKSCVFWEKVNIYLDLREWAFLWVSWLPAMTREDLVSTTWTGNFWS